MRQPFRRIEPRKKVGTRKPKAKVVDEPEPVLKVKKLPKPGKQAFLILGPESSGTRLHAKMLKANGVFGGDGHYQKLDTMDRGLLEGRETTFLRRSFPHGGLTHPVSPHILTFFEDYPVTAIVTMRAWKYLLGSHSHIKTAEQAAERYRQIFDFIFKNNLKYVMSSMEALIAHPGPQQAWLFDTLGLPLQKIIEIRDCNSKYE